eukprot:CAMPEP_0118631750 /NCGR_PEP_ID=MMETSP0785-20121206/72_1 /TAXON_ID=91992 /ORGANISM="Bolidomonas pacifica, Strain CCMP 1866" /LENGTH=350 /DNA_ID=CAMNT_0006522463 /DNA_START=233 /DNA_END=1288 /DNA_ORIENTATION=+
MNLLTLTLLNLISATSSFYNYPTSASRQIHHLLVHPLSLSKKPQTISCEHFETCSGCTNPEVLSVDVLTSARTYFSSPSVSKFFENQEGGGFEVVVPTDTREWRTQAKLATRPKTMWKGGVEFGLYKSRSHIVEPIPGCIVHHSQINRAVSVITEATSKVGTTAYVDPVYNSGKKKKKKGGSEEHTPSTPSKEPSSSSASTPSSPTSPISTASKAGSVVKEVVSEQERLKSEIEDLVPLKITLDGNVMSVGEGGKWEIMETEAVEGRRKIMELEGIIEGKDKEISSLSLATTSTTSTTNAMAFKLEVLLDMLSISRADVTKTERMLEKERIVSDEYRKELERVLKVCEDC